MTITQKWEKKLKGALRDELLEDLKDLLALHDCELNMWKAERDRINTLREAAEENGTALQHTVSALIKELEFQRGAYEALRRSVV